MEPERTEIENGTRETRRAIGWARWAAAGGLAVLVAGGAGVATAMSDGGGFGMHRFGGGMGGMGHFAERRIDRVLEEIEATDEQTEQLYAIFDAARSDLRPMMREFRGTREEIAKLLAAPTLDRSAAEALRAERIAAIDSASKRMTTAMLDAAEVLTAEQRAELMEHMEERGRHRRW